MCLQEEIASALAGIKCTKNSKDSDNDLDYPVPRLSNAEMIKLSSVDLSLPIREHKHCLLSRITF